MMNEERSDNILDSVVFDTFSLLNLREEQGNKTSKLLFVFFDAGETNALKPVIDELSSASMDFQILAFGTAWTLIKDHPRTIDIHKNLDVSKDTNQKEWGRLHPLDQKILDKILALLKPDIVITGMVSELQKQIIEGFKKTGADIIAYYDNFSPIQMFSYALPFVKLASLILVPSKNVAESVLKEDPNAKVDIVGHPNLELWIEQIQAINAQEIRRLLKIEDGKSFLVYITGYGEGYQEAFASFAKAIKSIKDFHVGISIHPKMTGDLEKQILQEQGCHHAFLIPKKVDTSSAVAIADLVVTWRSSIGVQAAFLGKPVIYLDNPGSTFKSLSIEKGWALQLFDSEELHKLLLDFETELISYRQRFSEGKTPLQSKDLILRNLVKNKKFVFTPHQPIDSRLNKLFERSMDNVD